MMSTMADSLGYGSSGGYSVVTQGRSTTYVTCVSLVMPLIVSSLPLLPLVVPRFSLLLHVVVPYHTKVVYLG